MTYLPLRLLRGFLFAISMMFFPNVKGKRKLGALIDVLRLNETQLPPVVCPDGSRICLKMGDFTSFSGFHDIYDNDYYLKYYRMKPGDVVVDIGANIGLFTLKAAKLTGPSGFIVTVEPDPFNFNTLLRNIRENNLQRNVIAINGAIGRYDGEAIFYASEYFRGGSSLYFETSYSRPIKVRTYTFENIMKRLNLSSIDFLKCDAEGAEVDLIRENSDALKRIKNVAVAVYHVSKTKQDLFIEILKHKGLRVLLTNGYLYATNVGHIKKTLE